MRSSHQHQRTTGESREADGEQGGKSSRLSVGASVARASEAKESMMRFIHRSWTAVNGLSYIGMTNIAISCRLHLCRICPANLDVTSGQLDSTAQIPHMLNDLKVHPS